MRRAVALVAVLASLGPACARPYLRWTPREPLTARRGKLAILVDDVRTGDPRVLGRAYGFGGVPRDVILDEGEVATRLGQLGREAATTAGLGLASTGEAPDARIQLRLEVLRCDGRGRTARAELALAWAITGPDGTPRTDAMRVDAKGSGSGCELAVRDVLDQLLDELAAKLVSGPSHEAVFEGT